MNKTDNAEGFLLVNCRQQWGDSSIRRMGETPELAAF